MTMLYRLRRHPIPMTAHFRHSLVLAYAFPREALQRLLPPGLVVDAYGEFGFAAAAVVQVDSMRPAGVPRALGRPYVLAGYRIFCRFRTPDGRDLRGLHILRSDADAWSMVTVGNVLTHYRYHHSTAELTEAGDGLAVSIRTRDGEGDLDVTADLGSRPASLPSGSPFTEPRHARRFAGPLPFTFDYEPETGSIVVIEGVRRRWDPQPVAVSVERAAFFQTARFGGFRPVLANAFYVADVDYLWRRGTQLPLPAAA
jgi:Uncharacterized conserved protein (COG2071)